MNSENSCARLIYIQIFGKRLKKDVCRVRKHDDPNQNMGVPAFFRWLSRKYPSIIVECIEQKVG